MQRFLCQRKLLQIRQENEAGRASVFHGCLHEGDSVHGRHFDVRNHDIRPERIQKGQRLLPVRCLAYDPALILLPVQKRGYARQN